MSAAAETVIPTSAPAAATRPFFWSLRRETWEHRAIFWAPLIAGALVLVSFLLNAANLPDGIRALSTLAPNDQHTVVMGIFLITAMVVVSVAAITNAFYCLDALHSERRDRSILFWKSLPVSDVTTVLSKLCVAALVVPAIALVVTLATQLLLLLVSAVVLLASGEGVSALLSLLRYPEFVVVMLYATIAATLWSAPIYGYLLLVSAWAKRAPFLWAVLVPLGAAVAERLIFNSSYLFDTVRRRAIDWVPVAFDINPHVREMAASSEGMHFNFTLPEHPLQFAAPLQFLSSPPLWIGLALCALFIAAAIWLRRYREPI